MSVSQLDGCSGMEVDWEKALGVLEVERAGTRHKQLVPDANLSGATQHTYFVSLDLCH